MPRFELNRRRFLTGASVAGAGVALSGCDALDGVVSLDSPARGFMAGANRLTYRVQRFLLGADSLAKEFAETEIRQPMRPNGVTNPQDATYLGLSANGFRDFRLTVAGLVERPLSLSLDELRAMPSRTQITRHDCVEGWSCIAKWTGVPLSVLLDQARPTAQARFVVFDCLDTIARGLGGDIKYYESVDLLDARHPQTIVAYGMNDAALPVANGAPLRVRIERQLGYKMAKYVHAIRLVDDFAPIGGGKGGYWEDNGYDWYAGI